MKPMLRQCCPLWCGDPGARGGNETNAASVLSSVVWRPWGLGVGMKPMLRHCCPLWCGDPVAGGGNETNAASLLSSVVWLPWGWGWK